VEPVTPPSRRGGRRPGAGAKKGNLNALKHGRFSGDDHLRGILQRIPAAERHALRPYLRRPGTIKHHVAPPEAPPNVLPFSLPPQHQQQPEQSNSAGLGHLALRMTAHGFFNAAAFLRSHWGAVQVVELVVDFLDAKLDDGTYGALRNPGGFIRDAVHEEIATYEGPIGRCPYCRWSTPARKEQQA